VEVRAGEVNETLALGSDALDVRSVAGRASSAVVRLLLNDELIDQITISIFEGDENGTRANGA
jgi:hypothetical protein